MPQKSCDNGEKAREDTLDDPTLTTNRSGFRRACVCMVTITWTRMPTAPERRDAIMANTIRTGIVGATVTQGGSGWGANAHVPALPLLPGYALQAVCTAHVGSAPSSVGKCDAVLAF